MAADAGRSTATRTADQIAAYPHGYIAGMCPHGLTSGLGGVDTPGGGDEPHRARHITRPSELGANLQGLHKRRDMTQDETAAAAHVGRKPLSQIENSKATAEIGLVFRLLAALGYRAELIASPPPKLDLHEHLARNLMSDTDATCICLPGGDETHRGGPRHRCPHH